MRKSLKLLLSLLLVLPIFIKWMCDCQKLPLTKVHWPLYLKLHIRFFIRLRRLPNIHSCRDYNEKIQWLKLFDQNECFIDMSDKLKVKGFVQERLGPGFTPKTLFVLSSDQKTPCIKDLPNDFVIKTNHDSGGVYICRRNNQIQFNKKIESAKNRLNKIYGISAGEWCYPLIEPKVFVEEYLDVGKDAPADFKFHCSNGKVLWLQYIYDRCTSPKEVIVSADGDVMDVWIYQAMEHSTTFVKPDNWHELIKVAEKLSLGVKYLRVDLYNLNGQVFVGELTLYPMGGMYSGDGQRKISNLLDFDRSTVTSPVLSQRVNSSVIFKK